MSNPSPSIDRNSGTVLPFQVSYSGMRLQKGGQMGTKKQKAVQYKWKFAIGTTSRVPGSKELHYLILDFDGKHNMVEVAKKLAQIGCFWVEQKTENGFHIYTNFITSLRECVILAGAIGADRQWIRIAESRGYFYLADKASIVFDWPVERMIIYRGKKTSQDTSRT